MPEGQSPAEDRASESASVNVNGNVIGDDDETLVRRARQGDPASRDELFRRHRGVAYRVAYRLLGNEHDAQDAVQDGLLKAFASLDDFDGRSGFRTWLVRVVTNAALDLGRKRGRRNVLSGLSARSLEGGRRPDDDPSRGLRRDDLRQALNAALGRLSPKLKTTFVLFAEGGLSYKEVAETQGVPIGTVMSRLHEARRRLQADPELKALEE